jgi:hypothetical protein
MLTSDLSSLSTLLKERLAIIANQQLREEQPAKQLHLLQQVSEAIQKWHQQNRSLLPAKLNHYLSQASFHKALEWIEQGA